MQDLNPIQIPIPTSPSQDIQFITETIRWQHGLYFIGLAAKSGGKGYVLQLATFIDTLNRPFSLCSTMIDFTTFASLPCMSEMETRALFFRPRPCRGVPSHCYDQLDANVLLTSYAH